jgi:hypothetical protein
MDSAALLVQVDRLLDQVKRAEGNWAHLQGAQAQICDFLSQFAGPNSAFLHLARNAAGTRMGAPLSAALENFRAYVEAGLAGAITPERRAQLDVVSDFLELSQSLLETKGVHPAAPIVLIGATLEEFLRTWIESGALQLGQRKPSLDAYAQVLLAEGRITKQDMKDITAWGGLRNHAAHGEWAEVGDKQRASIMLEGVNLFMRKYGAS